MLFKNNDKSRSIMWNTLFLEMIAGVFICTLFSGVVLKTDVFVTSTCALVQVFGVLIPGMALYTLLNDKYDNVIEVLTVSYAYGYSLNIISYFLIVPMKFQSLCLWYGLVLLIISLIILYKKKDIFCNDIILCKKDITDLLCFLLFFLIVFSVYSATRLSPVLVEDTYFHEDLSFWLENASALMHSFPPVDPRVSVGDVIYYHYFSSVQLAYIALITNIDIFSLGVTFYSVGKSIILFGSIYLLLFKFTRSTFWFGLILLLFSTGFERKSIVTYFAHLYDMPFGFDIGFAFGALFLYVFIQATDKPFNRKILGQLILTFFVCVGSKAPVAAVLIIVPAVVCLKWLFKYDFHKAFGYGLPIFFTFIFVMVMFVGIFHSGDGGLSLILPNYKRFICKWFLANPLILVLSLCSVYIFVKDKCFRSITNLALFVSYITGMLLGCVLFQVGSSEMYFSMAAFIPGAVLGLNVIEYYSTANVNCNKYFQLIFRFVLAAQVSMMLFESLDNTGITGLVKKGALGIKNVVSINRTGYNISDPVKGGFTTSDYEAMQWIRKNTTLDSVIISDRSVLLKNNGYMFFGVFSERQAYLEGDIYFHERYIDERKRRRKFIERFYNNDKEVLNDIFNEKIDYIVQTKWLSVDFKPDNERIKLVYSTDSINVYKVLK